ncbi:MAG: hypothetical protein E5Y63_06230 [Mesorhizobium sp.]|uniref:hypothetical protein n=1 Tax=Mesorhizobium sp. TaxID=1871066 RepID=UPI0012126531|nr:hypothetical protein [Mesorhizobium sp.]TIM31609.1 MAG: hypothetical protein E5Y63_06230 [Mesorhizobium sp.]
MIFLGILLCIAGIGFLCWLLFTLAVYALPFFVGVTAGMWTFGTGAGPLGAFVVGIAAAGATLAVGQITFTCVRPVWARLAVALLFAAPASVAGYHATHGLATLAVPSVGWQIAFSIVGAIAVGIAAWVRLLAMAPPEPAMRGVARG